MMLILPLFLFIASVEARRFMLQSLNRLTSSDNWVHHSPPCVGDVILFEENKKTGVFFDNNVNVQEVILPNDGVLTFSDNFAFGNHSVWQCNKRRTAEDIFYSPNSYYPSYYDTKVWYSEQPSILHMNQVPSANDEIFVEKEGMMQLFLDRPAIVNKFNLYGRELDQNQLNAFLNSIEGQFQVEQSREFAKEDDTDSLERFVSDKAITVVNSEKTLNSGAYVNENGKNETMTLICSTITCEQPHDCVNHVQPEGHCCPVCAGLLNLAFREVNPDEINTIIYESMSEVKDDDGTAMWDAYNYSLEKILEDQLSTRFQITIMPNESTTYDAEIMMDLLILCLKKFGRTNHLLKHYEIHTAKTRHVYKWSSIFLGTTIYAIIVLAAASFYIYRHPGVIGQLLRLFRRPEISLPRVFWVKTDDCVTLVNPNADIDTSDQSEEENSTSLESLSTLPEESPEESLQSETEVDPSEAGMQNIPLIEF